VRLAPTALAAVLVLAGVAVAGVKNNPENNAKLGPSDNAGYFLGHPTPTYSWHGCTRTARARTGKPLPQGAPLYRKGSKQKAVTFTVTPATAPYIAWRAKKKYKICGVQATVQLSNPDVDSDLLAEAGYTSEKKRGSTAADGEETIKVKIKKNEIGRQFEGFEGKTYSIVEIYDVTVFVKGKNKKRKKKR